MTAHPELTNIAVRQFEAGRRSAIDRLRRWEIYKTHGGILPDVLIDEDPPETWFGLSFVSVPVVESSDVYYTYEKGEAYNDD